MKLREPQLYRLRVLSSLRYRVTLSGSSRPGFVRPSTQACPKIYVVAMSRRIHYVGITRQPVARRFYLGFRATGKRGYYGYAWKHLRGPLRLFVWSFPKRKPALMKKFEKELETIEGEVVFLIRKVTNKWPMSQTEIHFHQPRAAHRAAAAAIFAEVTK